MHAAAAPAAIGPYSQGVLVDGRDGGALLFCSGQIPLDPQTGELACADAAGQTERCLRSLEAICREAGTALSRALRLTIYTTDIDSFAEINASYAAFFEGAAEPPARVTVGVAALPKGATVEIEAIVAARAIGAA